MTVDLTYGLPQWRGTQLNINVSVTATLNITAYTAQRKVSVLVLERVGTGLFGDEPRLIMADKRVCWRVPVIASSASAGRLGLVGEIDVDAQTGEILATPDLLNTIGDNADRLVARFDYKYAVIAPA